MGYSALLPLGSQLFLRHPVVVAQISPIETSGLYYISGSARLDIALDDAGGFCFDALVSSEIANQIGESSNRGRITVSITDALFINAGDSVEKWCYSGVNSPSSSVLNAGLTAILINSEFDAKQARRSRVHHTPVTPGAGK